MRQYLIILCVGMFPASLRAQAITISGTVKSLDGVALTTEVLNEGRKKKGNAPVTAAEFRNSFSISIFADPNRNAPRPIQFSFDPDTGLYSATLSAKDFDPKQRRIQVILSSRFLEDALLTGLTPETQSVNVAMPLKEACPTVYTRVVYSRRCFLRR